jgi:ribosomal protein L37AE/L43A
MGGTCVECGRAFIRQVRSSAGYSWSCPYCHAKQLGPTALDLLARRDRLKHGIAALRERDARVERKRKKRLLQRSVALKAARR